MQRRIDTFTLVFGYRYKSWKASWYSFFEFSLVINTRGHCFKLFKRRSNTGARSSFFQWACSKCVEIITSWYQFQLDSERSFPQQLCRHSGGPPACSIYIAPGAVDATAFINYMISTPVWQGINSTPGKMYHPSRLCGFHPLERWTQTIVIRYDTRCYFNVRSKADISQLNLPHGTDN